MIANAKGHQIGTPLRQVTLAVALVLTLLLVSGCAAEPVNPAEDVQAYEVDPIFREVYRDLGGEALLGSTISRMFEETAIYCQFTENAKLCYNPVDTGANRYFLAPLGSDLVQAETPLPLPAELGTYTVNGYTVYEAFLPLYQALGAEAGAGSPLTNPRYNYEKRRVEQYFEKAGFFMPFDGTAQDARLMPYGALSCSFCLLHTSDFGSPAAPAASAPFAPYLDRMGAAGLFGKPLSQPYTAVDGALEQVYDGAVIYAPAGSPGDFHFRQLSNLLGMTAAPPGARLYGLQENMVFYPTEGELGYHVPLVFDQFIAATGGVGYSGLPLSDPYLDPTDNVTRQCFENYCLDYDPIASGSYYTRVAPLGGQYLALFPVATPEPTAWPVLPVLDFKLMEEKPELRPSDNQTISIRVFMLVDSQPVADVGARLVLMLPDGGVQNYTFAPSAADGWSTLTLPPLVNYPNGSMITYQACLDEAFTAGISTCRSGSYLIWE